MVTVPARLLCRAGPGATHNGPRRAARHHSKRRLRRKRCAFPRCSGWWHAGSYRRSKQERFAAPAALAGRNDGDDTSQSAGAALD